jgi:phosphatidylethanolamine N-methyltransferase
MVDYLTGFLDYVDFTDFYFILSATMIIICPITWNLIARFEFHTKYFSKLAGDNILAADIFAHILIEMGIFRNWIFKHQCKNQRQLEISEEYNLLLIIISYFLVSIGFFIVCMSFYRLGIHGIYYADYFGILMKEKVTSFPYNVLDNPLYVGSNTVFLGTTLLYKSPSGLLLTILVWIMYRFASILENPMTDLIYSPENIAKVKKVEEERRKTTEVRMRRLSSKSNISTSLLSNTDDDKLRKRKNKHI